MFLLMLLQITKILIEIKLNNGTNLPLNKIKIKLNQIGALYCKRRCKFSGSKRIILQG